MDIGDSAAAVECRLPPGFDWTTVAPSEGFDWSKAVVPSPSCFANYHGIKLKHLMVFVKRFRASRQIVWFAGDSSLDNKVCFLIYFWDLNRFRSTGCSPTLTTRAATPWLVLMRPRRATGTRKSFSRLAVFEMCVTG